MKAVLNFPKEYTSNLPGSTIIWVRDLFELTGNNILHIDAFAIVCRRSNNYYMSGNALTMTMKHTTHTPVFRFLLGWVGNVSANSRVDARKPPPTTSATITTCELTLLPSSPNSCVCVCSSTYGSGRFRISRTPKRLAEWRTDRKKNHKK